MKKKLLALTLTCLTFNAYADNSVADVPILWTAVFSEIQHTSTSNSTQDYCVQHSPTTLVTTYQQITSPKGVTTLNGLNIRYTGYTTENKNDIYFYTVKGIISGTDSQGAWQTPITLYEQTLTGSSTIWTTWSTPKCKGIFIANPTFPNTAQQKNLPEVFKSLQKLQQ